MCITKVGKIVAIQKARATVKLVGDDRMVDNIDVSMVDAKVNSYVELYANLALGILSGREANQRKRTWLEVMGPRN
jgi:hydrogenase maturation factor